MELTDPAICRQLERKGGMTDIRWLDRELLSALEARKGEKLRRADEPLIFARFNAFAKPQGTATRRSRTYHVCRADTTPPTNGIPKEPQATPIKVILYLSSYRLVILSRRMYTEFTPVSISVKLPDKCKCKHQFKLRERLKRLPPGVGGRLGAGLASNPKKRRLNRIPKLWLFL